MYEDEGTGPDDLRQLVFRGETSSGWWVDEASVLSAALWFGLHIGCPSELFSKEKVLRVSLFLNFWLVRIVSVTYKAEVVVPVMRSGECFLGTLPGCR